MNIPTSIYRLFNNKVNLRFDFFAMASLNQMINACWLLGALRMRDEKWMKALRRGVKAMCEIPLRDEIDLSRCFRKMQIISLQKLLSEIY